MFETSEHSNVFGQVSGIQQLRLVARSWRMMALRGCVAILFSLWIYSSPKLTWFEWMKLIGFFAIADGVVAIMIGSRARWGISTALGVMTVATGLTASLWRDIPMTQSSLIGWWAIIRGMLDLGAAIQLRNDASSEVLMSLIGLLSLLFGSAVILYTGPGFEALRSLIPAYALAVGLLMLTFAVRLWLTARQHPNPEGWPTF